MADAVPADQWKTRPAEGRWSAGELVSHLCAIERAILSRTDKSMAPPFLGTLNAFEWLQFIASHEIRHMKQLLEIAATLPKTVTSLHK